MPALRLRSCAELPGPMKMPGVSLHAPNIQTAALAAKQSGTFDPVKFWEMILATKGITSFPAAVVSV